MLKYFFPLICVYVVLFCSSCQKGLLPKGSWYKTFHWNAEDFFDDPKVIELCHAIQSDDLKKVDQLIAAGADVNAKGKGNMTPLLWAFPENKLEMFTKILEHGADPNVQFTSDFNTRESIMTGSSVLELAAGTEFPGYFKAVMQHGGNPNLRSQSKYGEIPLTTVIQGYGTNKKESVQLLIDAGADVNDMGRNDEIKYGDTPLRTAISWGGQYDLAILLVEAGADWEIPHPGRYLNALHLLLNEEENTLPYSPPKQVSDYNRLVSLLKEKGADFEEARCDKKQIQDIRDKMEGKYPLEMILKEIKRQVTEKLKERYENRKLLKEQEQKEKSEVK